MNIAITLYGKIQSKKNSKNIVQRGNRKYIVPSENYKIWHEEQSWQLIKHRQKNPIEKCEIRMVFFPPDRKKSDLSNKAESVMDLLVDNHVLIDDNWFICSKLSLEFGEVRKNNPRVEIYIKSNA